jgi:hypothetical protein
MKTINLNLKTIIKSIITESYLLREYDIRVKEISTKFLHKRLVDSLTVPDKNKSVSSLISFFNDSNMRNSPIPLDPKFEKSLNEKSMEAVSNVEKVLGNKSVRAGSSWQYINIIRGKKDSTDSGAKFYITVDSKDAKNIIKFYEVLPSLYLSIRNKFASAGEVSTKFQRFNEEYKKKNDFLIFYTNRDVVEKIGATAKSLLVAAGVSLESRPFEVGVDSHGGSHSSIMSLIANKAILDSRLANEIWGPMVIMAKNNSPVEFANLIKMAAYKTYTEFSVFMIANTKDLIGIDGEPTEKSIAGFIKIFANIIKSSSASGSSTKEKSIERKSIENRVDSNELVLRSGDKKMKVSTKTIINKSAVAAANFNDASVFDLIDQFRLEKQTGGWIIAPNPSATNKTYLNGKKLTGQQVLNYNDVITIGNSVEDKKRGRITIA